MVGATFTQAYLAGLSSAFTPCVYPLIPVTLAIFGATAEAPRSRALFLALCYVFGIALTYTSLGLVTAQTGTVFGQFLGNPIVLAVITFFLCGVALYSLDLISFSFLATLQTRATTVGGVGPLPAFFMGAVSGIVAAPCVGPFLVTILTIAASSGDMLVGGALLFTYSLGFGTLFLVLAAFPNLVRSLPRPGNWMQWIKLAVAAALFLVLFSLWKPFFSLAIIESLSTRVLALGFLVAGILFGLFAIRSNVPLLKIPAALSLALAILPLLHAPTAAPQASAPLAWMQTLPEALDDARKRSTIAMVDLAAEWCAACKELEHVTFSDPNVQERLRSLAIARLDFTVPDDATDALSRTYRVQGLPTVLFLRPDGTELPNSRITGFVPPPEFQEHLDRIRSLQ